MQRATHVHTKGGVGNGDDGGHVFVGHGFWMVSRAMISRVEMVSRVWIWELDGFYGLEDERTRFPGIWMEPCKTTIKGRQVKTHAVNTAKMVGLPSASFLCWLDMFFSDGTSYILIYHDRCHHVSSVFIVEGVFFNAFQTVRISHQFLYRPKAGVGREGSCFAQEAKQRFEIEIVQIYGLADPLRLKESRKD